MPLGTMNRFVSLARGPLETNDADGYWEDLTPKQVWAAIRPIFGEANERSTTHSIEVRYHPQISLDTRIAFEDAAKGTTRYFYVRGVQNVDEKNRRLQLLCEETT
jgi:head-tail adaptor